ncbi:MAG TPA: mechanosensitive ion channel family protein [Rhizomicrobium sp.]|jgi:small-conductance mechanosensitive channel|nr:mechanosensitive ion channel family protein [Rhizomicrobium sp.]
MLWPLVTLILLIAARFWGEPSLQTYIPKDYIDPIVHGLTIAIIVVVFVVVDRLLRRFYWHGYLRKRRERETPALIQDIVTISLVLLGLSVGLWWQAGLTLTGIAAASGAVAFVLGIALQPVIQDLFAGLAINFEGSYTIGDWLTVYPPDIEEKFYGRVSGITWRSTLMTMEDGRLLMVPNRMLDSNPVMNHSRPQEAKRLEVEISVDVRVPSERVVDMLLGEAFKTIRKPGYARHPEPTVLLHRVTSDAADYHVRFYAYPNLISPSTARSGVLFALQEVVRENEVPLPVTQIEMSGAPNLEFTLGEQEIRDGLHYTVLFRDSLDKDELAELAKRCKVSEVQRGTVVMKQGDAPSSMFIILEGAASVSVTHANGDTEEVAISATGDVAGEMSLMTGAARTATVTALTDLYVLEITKEDIEELLRKSPELLEKFSRVLAQRQKELDELANRHTNVKAVETDLLARMKSFFSRAFG